MLCKKWMNIHSLRNLLVYIYIETKIPWISPWGWTRPDFQDRLYVSQVPLLQPHLRYQVASRCCGCVSVTRPWTIQRFKEIIARNPYSGDKILLNYIPWMSFRHIPPVWAEVDENKETGFREDWLYRLLIQGLDVEHIYGERSAWITTISS